MHVFHLFYFFDLASYKVKAAVMYAKHLVRLDKIQVQVNLVEFKIELKKNNFSVKSDLNSNLITIAFMNLLKCFGSNDQLNKLDQ